MLPVLALGPIEIGTYRLMYTLAILVGGSVAYLRLPQAARDARLRRGVLLTILGIILGLLLPGLLVNADLWLHGLPPAPTPVRVYAGLGLGLVFAWTWSRIERVALLPLTDRALPAFALGYAIARVGCLAAGCCGGVITDSPLGLYLPDDHGIWAMRYPLQIVSGGFQLLLFGGLLALDWQRRRLPAWLRRDGVLTAGYLILFCVERFSLDFLRADHDPVWGGLGQPQLLMLAGLAGAAGLMASALRKTQKTDVLINLQYPLK
jgi:phosphatidylglycerol:prolipoprotein diacylglycerol transferase